ncbi:hypothetical protein CH253_17955 [Rhodococcus sp. 06-156-3C]|uniref:hypothetical protein n=1 Tax=Nocardiaceae TaxID=85025 RepID=UPI000522EF72|nr:MULTISPECIES: hypothetical protein [Rhodococcus]OZD18342.1 hypothetical protein CH280_07280 [Rhodococcus sp. 06-156-4C]OZD18940.1 hypothetical protein CH253_17955 [Rhodococcus sp. 06-156-3C]OZD22450.1 hypothetical protein CH248_09540 [Rhodococcus sp. 06-156-4a]OZD34034.1 hypothetical protein CH247_08070 [Rhodococcus sp. 06-156-3b]OZD38771.1 hypothetical protein CH284_06490 [Rhodococcus sp. 06-156-3]
MTGRSARDQTADFGGDAAWVRCPLCGHRCLVPLTELYGDDRLCAGCALFVEPGTWETDAIDPEQTSQSVDWITDVAWFHTSTHSEWPPPEAAARDRAIHLGTYEAAVDSMFYRMSAMDEAHCPFHLHRVVLPNNVSINPRLGEDRGQMLTGIVDLQVATEGDHHGYRYVNRKEHRGSVSLALDPIVITAVQTVALPHTELLANTETRAEAAVARHDAECAAAEATLTAFDRRTPPPQLDVVLGRTAAGRRFADRDSRLWAAQDALYDVLDEEYLPDVSTLHRDLFRDAVRAMMLPRITASTAHHLYRLHSPTITFSDKVMALAAAEPVRRPTWLEAQPTRPVRPRYLSTSD